MKLYEYELGDVKVIAVAKDDTDAYEKRGEIDSTWVFMPVEIKELVVDGYTISVTASKKKAAE